MHAYAVTLKTFKPSNRYAPFDDLNDLNYLNGLNISVVMALTLPAATFAVRVESTLA